MHQTQPIITETYVFISILITTILVTCFSIKYKIVKRLFSKSNKSMYEYGFVKDRVARKNKTTQKVQFVLWKAGEQGHKEDYWYNFNGYWWSYFKLNKE